MKKILSFGLASAMVMSMGAAAFAKDDDALYPIGAISTNAYLYDSDDYAVDLSQAVSRVDYGETIYFPLLSAINDDAAEAIEAARRLLNEKTEAFNTAVSAHTNAVNDAAAKAEALTAAETAKTNAQAVLDAATAWNAGTGTQQAYNDALAAFDSALTPAADAATAVTESTTIADTAAAAFTAAETAKNDADALVTSAEAAKNTAETEKNDAQTALDELLASGAKYVYETDAVDGVKIKSKWEMNGKLIDSVELVKKKVVGESIAQKYIYFIEVDLKDTGSVTAADISGTIQLRKSGEFDYDEMELDVNMELAYETATDSEITEDLQIFKEGHGFEYGDSEEFTFECDDESYFEVNTNGQGKILLSATSDFDSDVALIYPNANLDFFYGNGASFNRIGTLYLAADPDSYLYQLKDDGRLVAVNAEYDEYDENFVIKTRTLGKYVISDVELPLLNTPIINGSGSSNNNSNNNSGTVDSVVTNPNTGVEIG